MVCLCCRPVTSYLEQWLRLMLRWDPKQRGGGMVQIWENAFRPKCFLLLDQILATKVSDIPVLWSLCGSSVHQQCSVLDKILATKVSGFPCPLEFVLDHCPPTIRYSVLDCCHCDNAIWCICVFFRTSTVQCILLRHNCTEKPSLDSLEDTLRDMD